MTNPVAEAQSLTSPVLDAAILARAKNIVEEKFPKMASYFIEDCAIYIGQITEALEALSAESLIPPAHTLKSSSRYMGALRMADIAEQIETEARETIKGSGSIVAVPGLLKELRRVFAETKMVLQTYLTG